MGLRSHSSVEGASFFLSFSIKRKFSRENQGKKEAIAALFENMLTSRLNDFLYFIKDRGRNPFLLQGL